RSLGPEPLVQVDVEGPHAMRQGDIYVVCSDGLSGPLSDREIGAVVTALPPQEACRFLIDLANLQGGPDNITAVVVRLGEPEEGAPPEIPLRKGPGWYQRISIPWPFVALTVGVLLAVAAVALTVSGSEGGVLIFLLAAASLLGGLAGLVAQHLRDKTRDEDEIE